MAQFDQLGPAAEQLELALETLEIDQTERLAVASPAWPRHDLAVR